MTRILPPFLVVLLLLPLILLWRFHPTDWVIRTDRAMPWDIPLALGLAALITARLQFSRAGAEINTFRQPRKIVTDGIFRFSRNPMYLGFLLLLTAAAFFVNTWCALLAPLAFLMAASLWYIPHEERAMQSTFGSEYDAYRARTRRWL